MRSKTLQLISGSRFSEMVYGFFERIAELRSFLIVVVFSMSLPFWAGCTNVNVRGRQRPLLQHTPLTGDVELVVEQQNSEQKGSGGGRESKVSIFEERLTLRTTGDIYHSNMLFFDIGLALALTQQDLSADEESQTADDSLIGYDIYVGLLSEKPYPMSFSTTKSETLISRQFLGPLKTEDKSSGFTLSLRSEEWPMRFQYSIIESEQDSFSSGGNSSDFFARREERFGYSLTHDFSELSRLTFDFEQNKILYTTTGSRTETKTDNYRVLHDLIFGDGEQHRLGSSLSFSDRSGGSIAETTYWNERLNLEHTEDFSTNYQLGFIDSKRPEVRTRTTRGSAGFRHQLYDSLITRGNVFIINSDSGNRGQTDRRGGGVSFNYRKRNPWGLLISSYSASIIKVEQRSTASEGIVIEEPHTVPDILAPRVELDRTSIISATIVVKHINGILEYQEGDDYEIIQSGGKTVLRLFIPPIGGGAVPNFVANADFLVDYDYVIEPEQKEEILRQNFSIRQQFDNGLSLYYLQYREDQDISGNVADVVPDESRSDTYGVDYAIGKFDLSAVYNKVWSTSIPSTSKSVRGSYSWAMGDNISGVIQASSLWADFEETIPRDLTVHKIGAKIFGGLTDRHTVSAGIDYFDEKDNVFGPTEGLQFDINLEYNYRQLSVTSGIEFDFLKREDEEDKGVFWYLRLKRFF